MSRYSSVAKYFSGIWCRRYFWLSLFQLDLHTRYKHSVLGIGWSLLQPLAMTAVLCVAFQKIFSVNLREYAPFVLSGMAIWNFITSVTVEGCQSLYAGEKYIRTHSAPMAIYSLRTLMSVVFHFVLILIVAMAVTFFLNGIPSALSLASLVPSLALLFLFGWATTTIFGFANVYFPDTMHFSQVGLQLLFYLTPIFYPPQLIEKAGFSAVLRFNPLGSFVELIRAPILYNTLPTVSCYAIASTTVILMILLAMTIVSRCEKQVIFYM